MTASPVLLVRARWPGMSPKGSGPFLRKWAVAARVAHGRTSLFDQGPDVNSGSGLSGSPFSWWEWVGSLLACKTLGIKHLRTRPYRPRTNGKAERFIRTLVEGRAYGAVYRTSAERTAALPGWLDWYNRLRPHRSLGRKPTITRLAEMNNVLGTNT